jgi:ribosome-associated protein
MIDDRTEAAGPDAGQTSKTQRKRQSHALQALGRQLTELTREELARVDLPEELREAIEFSRRVTAHEGRRRHMQYIGKLMRQLDADAVQQQLASATGSSRAAVARMHDAERWRDRLLADDAALTELLDRHAAADAQWLRATIRAARREQAAAKPPKHARELYRWLHEHLAEPGDANDASLTVDGMP